VAVGVAEAMVEAEKGSEAAVVAGTEASPSSLRLQLALPMCHLHDPKC